MNNQYSGIEKRKFKRVPVNFILSYKVNSPLEIRIRTKDREVEAVAADISEGGMGVYTDYEIIPASILTEKFLMINDKAVSSFDRSRQILVRGEVRYNVFVDEKRAFRFGLQFIGLSAEDRHFLFEFVSASK